MKPAKRLLSLLLALILCLSLVPLLPRAEAANVTINGTNFPDDNFRSYVEKYDKNNDGILSDAERNAVTEIACDAWGIRSLQGVEFFPALKTLECSYNDITSLDLSGNPALERLYCRGNLLSSLDVSQNPALITLSCLENDLTSLDLSKNAKLRELMCVDNQLKSLNLHGDTALKELFCDNNELTSLDLSGNPALEVISCPGNQLTSLNLSGNPALEIVSCSGNQLTGLDLSENPDLRILECKYNQLRNLDFSKNTALESVYCDGNLLTSLDLRPASSLNYTVGCYRWNGKEPSTGPNYVIYWSEKGDVRVDRGLELLVNVTPFADVKEEKYYYEPVYWAYYHDPQITSGTNASHFSPGNDCTREQIVTFLWRTANQPEVSDSNPFRDVKSGKYYYQAVLWACQNGITNGVSDELFGVGKPCTREQAVTFLWRVYGSPAPKSTENPFTDVKSGKYYYDAVLWAVENGVTNGTSATTFGVGKTCTRGQIVAFLYRADHVLRIVNDLSQTGNTLAIEVAGGYGQLTYKFQKRVRPYVGAAWRWQNVETVKTDKRGASITATESVKYRCIVTDEKGNEVISQTVSVSLN